MANIIDYAKSEKSSWAQKALNEVDSLVFSQLAYTDFAAGTAELKKANGRVSLKSFAEKGAIKEAMFANVLSGPQTTELLAAVAKSPRFSEVQIAEYVSETNQDLQKQFAAMCFIVDEQTTYVAFRGTDDTILGWKEDFNMSYLQVTPSQKEAARYLEKVAAATAGDLIVGGHSKGGNLAVYATLMVSGETQKRIKAVYSHDGPGVNMNWWQSWRYQTIKDKIFKTLPQSSPVGILLETQTNYRIVKSSRHSIMQHDPFSWLVNVAKDEFIYTDKMARSVRYFDKSLHTWLRQIPRREREKFIDTLYEILTETKITTVQQFVQLTPAQAKQLLRSFKNMDEQKKFLGQALKNLAKIYWQNMKS